MQKSNAPPTGFEPVHPPPEGGALSPELRGLGIFGREIKGISARIGI